MADPAAGASGESSHSCCHILWYMPLISLMRAMAEDVSSLSFAEDTGGFFGAITSAVTGTLKYAADTVNR